MYGMPMRISSSLVRTLAVCHKGSRVGQAATHPPSAATHARPARAPPRCDCLSPTQRGDCAHRLLLRSWASSQRHIGHVQTHTPRITYIGNRFIQLVVIVARVRRSNIGTRYCSKGGYSCMAYGWARGVSPAAPESSISILHAFSYTLHFPPEFLSDR